MKTTPLQSQNSPSISDTRKEISNLENKLISTHEKKVQEINDYYKNRTESAKELGKKRLDEEEVHIGDTIDHRTLEYSTKLKEMQGEYDKTKDFLAREKQQLSYGHQESLDKAEEEFQKEFIQDQNQNVDYIDNKRKSFATIITKVNNDNRSELNKTKAQNQNNVNKAIFDHQLKVDQEKSQYQNAQFGNQMKYAQELNVQRIEQERALKSSSDLFHREMQDRESAHLYKVSVQNKKNHEQIKHSSETFQKKYFELMEKFKQQFEELEQLSNKKIDELKRNLILKETLETNQLADPFYRPGIVHPNIQEHPQHYTVTLKIPPHEEEKVLVSANGRQIRLTRFRDYEDSLVHDDGSINKYGRSESFVKSLQVDHILDAKKIAKNYNKEKGLLIFTIPKA